MYISPIWGAKTPGWIELKFVLVVDVPNIITPFKFGDDRFRGFGLAEGQILHFPIDFEGRPCADYRVRCDARVPRKAVSFMVICLQNVIDSASKPSLSRITGRKLMHINLILVK